jgi:hypothetical protein
MKGITMTEKVDFTNYLPEEEKKSVDISEVKDVSEASNRFLKIESDILALEDQVKRKKAELMQMNDSIVQLMESRGVKEKEVEAFGWLEENGHGDLIKNIVSVRFGKGENDNASRLIEDLEQNGLTPDQKRKVEPMTLNAFLGEQIKTGKDVPTETFGVYMGYKVKIKRGK